MSVLEEINNKIQEAKSTRPLELDLSSSWSAANDQKLTEFPYDVLELDFLQVLNLANNRISSIPESISHLRNLISLDFSGNQLVEIPESFSQLKKLTRLNLSRNQLSEIPESLSQLKNLTWFDLSSNRLAKFPESADKLNRLTDLNLGFNHFSEFPESISGLRNLSLLDISGNQLSEIPDSISDLVNLTSLNVAANRLSNLGSIFQLQKLTSLDLSNNPPTDFPSSISQLQNLTNLSLNGGHLTVYPQVINGLRKLTNLSLVDNQLTVVPDSIGQLEELKSLALGRNRLADLPPSISRLKKLEDLLLYDNQFEEIPAAVYELSSLTTLDFDNVLEETGNNNIKEISPKIVQLTALQEILLEKNPVTNPPPEVVANGVRSIEHYFKQLGAEGRDYLYEAKLLIVGEGGAGKTSLAKKIEDPSYELQEEDSTKGIEVISWTFKMENGQPFRVNIWDFGGQEIYHATHQFFLTKRSLYALVADTRKEDTDFYYWLNAVEQLSDNSPLLIVSNEKQERQREINERQLRGDFSNLKATLATNLATNRGLDKVVTEIKHYVSSLPQIGAPLPKTWVKVRETLEKDSRNYMALDEYLRVCEENGFSTQTDKFQLSGYLHDLGVCLHFQDDPLLRKTVILKPKWGTDAVYKILDNERVIGNLGKFNRDDLANIWREAEYANMQDELLQLMINFKLCYRIGNSSSYIAPQRLTENQPDYKWDETNNLILRYTYESFMPKGILTQFIVAMHKLIAKQDYVWKSGVILEKDRTRVEVVEDYKKREVRIRVAGKNKKELLTIVSYELDNIHGTYKRLNYTKLIPCNCAECKDSQTPYFYAFETLQKFIEDRQENIQCQASYKMVDVRSLIDDVLIRSQVPEDAKKKGDFIFQAPVGKLVIQQAERGDNIVKEDNRIGAPVKSAWANGSFYLFTFAVVIAGLGVLARSVPAYALGGILIAGVIFVPMIGAFQLRQDDRLSEKTFFDLMKMVVGQLPLIGKLFGGTKQLEQ